MESAAINLAGRSSCFPFHITAPLISQISFRICLNIVPSQEALNTCVFVLCVFIIKIVRMLANMPVRLHPKQANEEAKEQISPQSEAFSHRLFLSSTMLSSSWRIFVDNR